MIIIKKTMHGDILNIPTKYIREKIYIFPKINNTQFSIEVTLS